MLLKVATSSRDEAALRAQMASRNLVAVRRPGACLSDIICAFPLRNPQLPIHLPRTLSHQLHGKPTCKYRPTQGMNPSGGAYLCVRTQNARSKLKCFFPSSSIPFTSLFDFMPTFSRYRKRHGKEPCWISGPYSGTPK